LNNIEDNQEFLDISQVRQHYDIILESAYNKLEISSTSLSDFSLDLVYYLIFKRLQELNCDECFNLLFANHPLAKVANFKENLDLPAILNICKVDFHIKAIQSAPTNLKDNEKLFKDLEKLAIPLVNQKVSILSKLPTKPDPSVNQNNQISDPSPPPPPSNFDKRRIFLYSLPIWILAIGVIVFFIVRRKRQRGGK
jgi:hypothetical protein